MSPEDLIKIQKEFPTFEFRGKPWVREGFTWQKAFHRCLGTNFRFCYELKCGADSNMYEFICKNKRFA